MGNNIYYFRLQFYLFTEEVNKVALSAEDDKRIIMPDGINTKAYGHYALEN